MALVHKINEEVTKSLLSTTQSMASGAIDWLVPIFKTLAVIYFAVWGYLLWTGISQEPLRDSILKILRVSAVSLVALTFAFYNAHIIKTAYYGPTEVLNGIEGTQYQAINQLDSMWSDLRHKGYEAVSEEHSWGDFGGYIRSYAEASLFWAAAFILIIPPFLIIMLSKVLLSVLLAVGPVFIVAALFRRGVGFTQAWVGQVLTYMFVNILIMVLMNFAADSVFGLINRGMDNQRPA